MTISPKTGKMSDEEFKVDAYRHEGQNWFSGSDVGRELEYADGSVQKMIAYHVPDQFQMQRADGLYSIAKNKPVYLSEVGVKILIAKRAGKQKAAFEAWFDKMAAELSSGHSQAGKSPLQISIRNETDLHYKVVDYTRRFYPRAVIIAGLGALQDSEAKRIDAKCKGYTSGQPDLILMNSSKKYKAFAIELKHPGGLGELRENQRAFLERLQQEGCKTMVSCDYDEICRAIMMYFEDK